MSTLQPTTPVIVGVGQVLQRPEDLDEAQEPVRLMIDAVQRAQVDAGVSNLIRTADLIAVVAGAWRYSNPARLIATDLGAINASTALTTMGGQSPMAALGHLASEIQAGRVSCAVLTGGETIWSRRRLRRAGQKMVMTEQSDDSPDLTLGDTMTMTSDFEKQRNISEPIVTYPLLESAIRHNNGESLADHRQRISELWARFNKVAADNPYAWSPQPLSAEQIRQESPENRMVGFPYTKAMNSNWDLDQASAVIMTSVEAARAAGITPDKWIFPHATAEANDTAELSRRRDFHSSPAIGAAGRALFETTGQASEALSDIDLYSCFPSAVQIAATELGISQDRTLTVTGGLTFAGGPLNNYVGHSIAAMATTLRDRDEQAVGLVTANGGFVTKHALGLLGNAPPARPYVRLNAQEQADDIEPVSVESDYVGAVEIEAYTVMHDRDGTRQGRCALKTPSGTRTWGLVDASSGIDQLLENEGIGRQGHLDDSGQLQLD